MIDPRGRRTRWAWLLTWCVTALLSLALLVGQWRTGLPIVSDMSYLLPPEPNALKQEIIEQQNSSFRSRYLVLISAPEQALVQAAHEELTRRAADVNFISAVPSQLPAGFLRLLKTYPYALLTAADQRALETGDGNFIAQSALNFWLGFTGPTFLSPREDPLALSGKYLQGLASRFNTSSEALLTPVLTAPGQWQQILPLSHLGADNALEAQQASVAQLQGLLEQVQSKHPGVRCAVTGLAVHSVKSAEQTQREIVWISSFATLVIIGLSLAVYRRLLPLLAAFGTIVFGSLVGIVACIGLFKQIHILAIAFGTSLMGVVVDYAFHYFSVQRRVAQQNVDVLRLILPGMSLSLVTALAGYLGLWQSGMAVLQQIAFLCVVGILAAFLTIVALYPYLPPLNLPARHLPVERLLTHIARLWRQVPTRVIYIAFILLISGVGARLSQSPIAPNITALYSAPAELKTTERAIAQIYKEFVPNQYVALVAANPAELIQHLTRIKPQLEAWLAAGLIKNYQDLSLWVPDLARVQANAAQVQALLHNPQIQAIGAQFDLSVEQLTPQPVQLSSLDWLNQLPATLKTSLFVPLKDGRVAGLIRFSGIEHAAALHQAIAAWQVQETGLTILDIDTVQAINQGLSLQTQRACVGLAMAFALALLVLVVFYRNRTALALIAVPLAACAITLGLISAFANLSLFHILALFLALGLGVDYAILFSHSAKFPDGVSAEIVTLAAIGNALSFGLLSLTSLPMLAAFGLATSLCLICNFIFAPLVVRWVVRP